MGVRIVERRRRARLLCARLSRDVRSIAPAGVGSWEPAWTIVAEADAEFVLALTKWEECPTSDAREGVRQAYEGVMEAWRRAAGEFRRSSRAQGLLARKPPSEQ